MPFLIVIMPIGADTPFALITTMALAFARGCTSLSAGLIDPAQLPDSLTLDILRGVARGKSNRELALELHISVRTLCRTLAAVRELWRVEATIEAVVIAARLGLI
ncbi:hypothetical protein [Aeromicrobium sp. UC242_57]|uniref:hypothetical protein n=1 Tax=Aeromicrobium sp. UC242_57 TaxID=3374624 RepID=UPI0037B15763